MRRVLSLLTVSALALAGCATDDDTDPSTSPSPTAAPTSPSPGDPATVEPSPSATDDTVAAMEFTTCDAPEFTIPYPAEWQTNDPDGLVAACRVFHPGPVDLPDQPQDRDLHWAVSVTLDNVAFSDVTSAERTGEVLQQRDTTVAGRDAQVIETRSQGTGLVPEGELRYSYAVDLDGRTLFAHTYSIGDTDYERDKQVLDRMVSELEITQTEPVAGPATTERTTAEPSGDPVVVTGLEVAGHGTFDRLVLAIGGDGEVGWDIAYEDDPRSQGSGNPVDVAGEATLRVTLVGVALPPDAPEEPREGPERIQPEGTMLVREVLDDTIYEGRHDFFVGLGREAAYRVERLSDPQRLVVDIETG